MLEKTNSPKWWRGLLLSSLLCTRLKEWGRGWPPSGWPSIDNEQIVQLGEFLATAKDLESPPRNPEGKVTTISFGNICIGDGAKVGNLILASKIQESFIKAESADIQVEFKETLKQLTEAVNAMNKSLSEEQAAETTEDLAQLVDEATKPAPNRKWYSVSIEGLIKAAENVE